MLVLFLGAMCAENLGAYAGLFEQLEKEIKDDTLQFEQLKEDSLQGGVPKKH